MDGSDSLRREGVSAMLKDRHGDSNRGMKVLSVGEGGGEYEKSSTVAMSQ